jgi:hypothetical protein
MRAFRLARIALQAEILHLRYQARRTVNRVIFACCAVVMMLGVLVFGHIAAWYWLRTYMAGQYVGLIFMGIDLLFAAILGMLAARSSPGRVELEALNLRRRTLDDAAASLSVTAMLAQVANLMLSSRRKR